MKITHLASPSVLWRADKDHTAPNTLASVAYIGAEIKFFATKKEEIRDYATKSPYEKQWRILQPLNLLDIMDVSTRDELFNNAPIEIQKSIDIAFPKDKDGKVFRYSEAETASHDYKVLNYICRLPTAVDGYFMDRQQPRNNGSHIIIPFHSEVGLCRSALSKLILQSQEMNNPPALVRQRPPPSEDHKKQRSPARTSKDEENDGPPLVKRRMLNFDGSGKSRRRLTRKIIRRRKTNKHRRSLKKF